MHLMTHQRRYVTKWSRDQKHITEEGYVEVVLFSKTFHTVNISQYKTALHTLILDRYLVKVKQFTVLS